MCDILLFRKSSWQLFKLKMQGLHPNRQIQESPVQHSDQVKSLTLPLTKERNKVFKCTHIHTKSPLHVYSEASLIQTLLIRNIHLSGLCTYNPDICFGTNHKFIQG